MRIARAALPLLSLLALAAPLAAQQQVRAEYDAAADKTILHLERVTVDSVTQVSALTIFAGRSTGNPENGTVVMLLWLNGAGADTIAHPVPLSLRVRADSTAWTGRAMPNPRHDPAFAAVLLCAIPLESLRTLADAAHPELVLGTRVIPVSDALKEAIRQFLERATTPSSSQVSALSTAPAWAHPGR